MDGAADIVDWLLDRMPNYRRRIQFTRKALDAFKRVTTWYLDEPAFMTLQIAKSDTSSLIYASEPWKRTSILGTRVNDGEQLT